MSEKKKSSLEVNLEVLNNYVEDKQYKADELVEIISRLNSLVFMVNVDYKKKKESMAYIGTEEWKEVAYTVDSIKVRIAKLVLDL
jgi:acyl-CoA hydrolase